MLVKTMGMNVVLYEKNAKQGEKMDKCSILDSMSNEGMGTGVGMALTNRQRGRERARRDQPRGNQRR